MAVGAAAAAGHQLLLAAALAVAAAAVAAADLQHSMNRFWHCQDLAHFPAAYVAQDAHEASVLYNSVSHELLGAVTRTCCLSW
jgi:hypothetical protein